LSFDGIFGGAEERFDTKMLFDPLEEQLDSPAQAVKLVNRERRQDKIVGQKIRFFQSRDL
jgi:hypothetical protein